MWNSFKRVLILSSIFLLVGCSNTIDQATQNAMNACGIVIYDPEINDSVVVEGSPKSGDYFFSQPDNSSFWSVDDPLPSHRQRSETWESRAISASSASKLDSKYAALSIATTNLANANSRLVLIKTQMMRDSSLRSYNDWSFLNSYSNDLNTWGIECASIIQVLNN
jgi:hypothetical protein